MLHFLDQSKLNLFKHSRGFNIPIPKYVFNEDYPIDPKTYGERIRKARMDAGLLIKEFAKLIGVIKDTVINLELRGMRPWRRDIRDKVNQFIENERRKNNLTGIKNVKKLKFDFTSQNFFSVHCT